MTSTACFLSRVSSTRLEVGGWRLEVGWFEAAFRRFSNLRKSFLHRGFHFRRFHVAINRQHAVVRHGKFLVKRFQSGNGNFFHGFLRAERIQTVAVVAEQRAAHGQAGALEQIVLARADAGDLDFLFALQFVGGKTRIQHDVGEQIQSGRKIRAQHLGVHAKTVVAAVAVQVAADGFDLRGDLFRAALLRAFDEHLGEQHRRAVVPRRFPPARRLGTRREIPRTAGDDLPSPAASGRSAK